MSTVIVATPRGDLILPAELLPSGGRQGRFRGASFAGQLLVTPEPDAAERRSAMTPEERAREFREWASRPRPHAPGLSDEAVRRENIYD